MISELDTSHHYMDSLTDVDRYRSHTRQNLSAFGLRSRVEGPMLRIRQERSVYLKVTGKDDSWRIWDGQGDL